MSARLLTGNAAVAWGARLAGVDYVPAFPITPQTEIIEKIGAWIDRGEMDARMVTLESEHSMVTAAGAAAATGARVFTATSSQGLLYGLEMVYTVAGWRVPFVMVNVSRALASPVTLEPDHNDIMAARDTGMLQLHAATCQEALDATLIGYRVAEDARVRLPVIVNIDGFYLSFTREPVTLPEPAAVEDFLPAYAPGDMAFRGGRPFSEAVAVLGGTPYSYFRYETHAACLQGEAAFVDAAAHFAELTGRRHAPVACYRADDAEMVFVMLGSFATKAMDAVDRLRDAGIRAGLVRPLLFRPFPATMLRQALAGKRAAAVIDQNLSTGRGGVLHSELAAALYGMADAPPVLASYVGGLGGRDIGADEFYEIARETLAHADAGTLPAARLMYRQDELRQVRKLQAVAVAEQESMGGKA
ncbi:MAG: pyruvate synthase [Gammaproteobacteria bacterium]